MNERPCIRCEHPVLLEDGHLVYCTHCGAPQIFLSQELQAEIAQQTEDYNQRHTQTGGPEATAETPATRSWRPARHRAPWPRAVQYALLSAGVALLLGLVTLILPAAGFAMLLWAVSAPMLTVAFFIARSVAREPTSSGFAAKLGLLTGMLVALVGAVVSTLNLVLTRYVQHDPSVDAQITAVFAQQRASLIERMGSAAQPTLNLLTVPEFRVGMLLCIAAMGAVIYLVLSTLAAGLTGAVLGRRRPA